MAAPGRRGEAGAPRIALLIDADNSSANRIGAILGELASYGECSIRRAYGNWTKPDLRGWAGVLHERAIRPVQQYDYSQGKNASDMALVVDAMALLYTDEPDAFALVSSDADFTPLVMHLRERGCAVYGFGQRKTPEPFVSACSRFLYVEQLDAETGQDHEGETGRGQTSTTVRKTTKKAATKKATKKATEATKSTTTTKATKKPAAGAEPASAEPASTEPTGGGDRRSTAELRQDARLVQLLRTSAAAAADEDGWATVSAVGQRISNQSSFDSRNYGYASLSKLVRATELFELRGEGSSLAIRDARHG